MQALYAYKQAEGANFQLSLDLIADDFAPDLNSMEFQDREKLEGYKKLGQQLLQEAFSRKEEDDFTAPQEVLMSVEKAKDFFLLKNKKDVDHYAGRMILEAEKVYDFYLQILLLFIELADRAEADERNPTQSKLSDNQIIKKLRQERLLETQAIRRNVNWSTEQVLIAKLYREVLRNNSHYTDYCARKNHTLEEDFAFLKYMLKNVILKNELTW